MLRLPFLLIIVSRNRSYSLVWNKKLNAPEKLINGLKIQPIQRISTLFGSKDFPVMPQPFYS